MAAVERFRLAPEHTISRVIKGGWQLAGDHGTLQRDQVLEDMRLYAEAGITTFDCADIYTGVEELIGEFLRRQQGEFLRRQQGEFLRRQQGEFLRRQQGEFLRRQQGEFLRHQQGAMRDGTLPEVQIHTKYVPDLDTLPALTRQDVEAVIDRSLRRLGIECLDLVQFHWWDYDQPGYVETALHLEALRRAGKVKQIGVTNMDVAHLEEILEAGVPVVSNQVQYSVLDHRPERGMVALCERHRIALLCYGTVAGGFLTERYLSVPEPVPPFENRSLTKYELIVDDFGGWELFQQLLATLNAVANKHKASIPTVATRYVLQKKGVAAAIVGARHARHLPDTLRIFDFALDQKDLDAIDAITRQAQGPAGDVYSAERVKGGKHAAIMKYNLNRE